MGLHADGEARIPGEDVTVSTDLMAPTKAPRSAAERMRLYRRRRRHRRLNVRVEVDGTEVDALVRRAYLQPAHREDLYGIGLAVSTFLSDALVTL